VRRGGGDYFGPLTKREMNRRPGRKFSSTHTKRENMQSVDTGIQKVEPDNNQYIKGPEPSGLEKKKRKQDDVNVSCALPFFFVQKKKSQFIYL
jgi:hypothetical protein